MRCRPPVTDRVRPSAAAQNFSPLLPFNLGRSPYRPFNRLCLLFPVSPSSIQMAAGDHADGVQMQQPIDLAYVVRAEPLDAHQRIVQPARRTVAQRMSNAVEVDENHVGGLAHGVFLSSTRGRTIGSPGSSHRAPLKIYRLASRYSRAPSMLPRTPQKYARHSWPSISNTMASS